jgi:hypothetical protein
MDLGVFTADYNGRYGLGYISQDGNSYFDVYNRTSISNSNLNKGYIQYTRTSSNLSKVFYKNNLINTNTNINSQYSNPNNTIYLGALHLGSGLDSYSNREQSFVTIGDGLNDTESTALYNAVQKYQTTLGRQVDVPLVSDSDAQAFLTAAGITSYTQANAVNTLVVDLKSAGVWTKMKALYPFVGGTATSHKWNLKDPRDLDVAYRLTFNGGMSHDSRGIVPNGTTGYANTFIDPYVLSINSGFGYYSQTNNKFDRYWCN